MIEEVDRLVSEIQQIKVQYVAEVGSGRRTWPRSIKERVASLDELGLAPKIIARRCEIPYDTVILWRYKRAKQLPGKFHEVTIAKLPISKSGIVTVPDFEMPQNRSAMPSSLRLTTPAGFVVEGLDEKSIARIIFEISKGAADAL